MTESEYTPTTLRAAFSDPMRYVLPPGSMTLEPEQKVAGKFADAWEAEREWKKAYDEGEVVGMMSNTTDAENPYPEGSHPYCGWSFGFWGSRNASMRKALEAEVAVDDKLLKERQRVLDAIPECPEHGRSCIPHAIEWVEKTGAEVAELRGLLTTALCGDEVERARLRALWALPPAGSGKEVKE